MLKVNLIYKVMFKISSILVFVLWPTLALAVQGHGGAEGLVAHEIGHVFFIFCICYLFFKIKPIDSSSNGWFEFKIFLGLLFIWNIVTFTGHWMNEFIDPGKFIKREGQTVGMVIDGLSDALFYLTRLDHLFLVPAFLMLLLALRKWRLEP